MKLKFVLACFLLTFFIYRSNQCTISIVSSTVYALCNVGGGSVYTLENATEMCNLNGYDFVALNTSTSRLCSLSASTNISLKNETNIFNAQFIEISQVSSVLQNKSSVLLFSIANIAIPDYTCPETNRRNFFLAEINATISAFYQMSSALQLLTQTKEFDIISTSINNTISLTEQVAKSLEILPDTVDLLFNTFKYTCNDIQPFISRPLTLTKNASDTIKGISTAFSTSFKAIPSLIIKTYETFSSIQTAITNTNSFLTQLNTLINFLLQNNYRRMYMKLLSCRLPLANISSELLKINDLTFAFNQMNYNIQVYRYVYSETLTNYRKQAFCENSSVNSNVSNQISDYMYQTVMNFNNPLERMMYLKDKNATTLYPYLADTLAILNDSVTDVTKTLTALQHINSTDSYFSTFFLDVKSGSIIIQQDYIFFDTIMIAYNNNISIPINSSGITIYSPVTNSTLNQKILDRLLLESAELVTFASLFNNNSNIFRNYAIDFKTLTNGQDFLLKNSVLNEISAIKNYTLSADNIICSLEFIASSVDRVYGTESSLLLDAVESLSVLNCRLDDILDYFSNNVSQRLYETQFISDFSNFTLEFSKYLLQEVYFNYTSSIPGLQANLIAVRNNLKTALDLIYIGLTYFPPTTTTTASTSTSTSIVTNLTMTTTINSTTTMSTTTISSNPTPPITTTTTIISTSNSINLTTTISNNPTTTIISTSISSSSTTSTSAEIWQWNNWQPWSNCVFIRKKRNLTTNLTEINKESVSCDFIITTEEKIVQVQKIDEIKEKVLDKIDNATQLVLDNLEIKFAGHNVAKNVLGWIVVASVVVCVLFFVILDFVSIFQARHSKIKKNNNKKIEKKKKLRRKMPIKIKTFYNEADHTVENIQLENIFKKK